MSPATAADDASRAGRPARLLSAYVVLVALHSYAVGAFLVFATEWGAAFGGFGAVSPLFFASQAGIFHFVLATAYLVEWFRYGGVVILLAGKATAVVFLVAMWALGTEAWSVPFSALGDGLMGLAALVLSRRASPGRSA